MTGGLTIVKVFSVTTHSRGGGVAEEQLVVEDTTVDGLMASHPATMVVFNAFGVDTCCGAHRTVRAAAEEDGADQVELVAALRQAIEKTP